jgi:hypothetical protein
MQKSIIFIGLLGFSLAYGEDYVVPATTEAKGVWGVYTSFKGYQQEWTEGTTHREVGVKYGIKWVPLEGVELYINPPLIRHHLGRGEVAYNAFGDMDVGGKIGLVKFGAAECPGEEVIPTTFIGMFGFARVPTGASDIPLHDNWCPKFSNGVVGGGVKLTLTHKIKEISNLHLNIGFLKNIGDVVDTANPIPKNRVPLNIGASFFPHKKLEIFVESEKDMPLGYKEKIDFLNTPTHIVLGIKYQYKERINFLFSVEGGTWGTGDPPLNPWYKGYFSKEEHPWVVSLGVSYLHKKVKRVPTREEEELRKLVEGYKKELEDMKAQHADEISLLKERLAEAEKKPKFEWKCETYVVKKGDCLWKIAGSPEFYGKNNHYLWHFIYHINREKIKNPHLIYPGMELRILKLPLELLKISE